MASASCRRPCQLLGMTVHPMLKVMSMEMFLVPLCLHLAPFRVWTLWFRVWTLWFSSAKPKSPPKHLLSWAFLGSSGSDLGRPWEALRPPRCPKVRPKGRKLIQFRSFLERLCGFMDFDDFDDGITRNPCFCSREELQRGRFLKPGAQFPACAPPGSAVRANLGIHVAGETPADGLATQWLGGEGE